MRQRSDKAAGIGKPIVSAAIFPQYLLASEVVKAICSSQRQGPRHYTRRRGKSEVLGSCDNIKARQEINNVTKNKFRNLRAVN